MKLAFLILGFCVFLNFNSTAKSEEQTTHAFHDGETMWFLGNLYYGKGSAYQKILDANHIKSASDIKSGQKLVIPSPTWNADGKGNFEAHYKEVWERREQKLHRSNQPPALAHEEVHAAVMVPKKALVVAPPEIVHPVAVKAAQKTLKKQFIENEDQVLTVPIPKSDILTTDGMGTARQATDAH